MANQEGIVIRDTLTPGIKRTNVAMMGAARRGMLSACMSLAMDTIEDLPKTPVDSASLRSSGSVFVDNVFKWATPDVFTGQSAWGRVPTLPSPATDLGAEGVNLTQDVIAGTVTFNKEYAAQWHENLPGSGHFQLPGAGIKYMERKMFSMANKYFAIIQSHVMFARRGERLPEGFTNQLPTIAGDTA